MKRNSAIFSNLLNCARIDEGLYVNVTQVSRHSLADYIRPPQLTEVPTSVSRVRVLQPIGALPLSQKSWQSSLLSGQLIGRQLCREFIKDRAFVLWANAISPIECGIVGHLSEKAEITIFDNSDDMPTLEPPEMLQDARRRLGYMLSKADRAVCVNERVASSIDHPNKIVFRNCTSYEQLQVLSPVALPPWLPKPAGAVYVGFIGSFHESRIDVALVEYLCKSCPAYQFLIVGWVSQGLEKLIASYSNLHHVAEVPIQQLGTVIRSFDAAMVPHLNNECTMGNDLLKVRDLNACEVPVVSTAVSGVDTDEYVLHVANTKEEFLMHLQSSVEGRHGLDLQKGREMARQRSWQVRVPALARELGIPLRLTA